MGVYKVPPVPPIPHIFPRDFSKKCERDFSLYIGQYRFFRLSTIGLTQSDIRTPTTGILEVKTWNKYKNVKTVV